MSTEPNWGIGTASNLALTCDDAGRVPMSTEGFHRDPYTRAHGESFRKARSLGTSVLAEAATA